MVQNLSSLAFSILQSYCLFSPFLQASFSFLGNAELHKKMVKENFLPSVPAYVFILGGDTILGLRERLLLVQSTNCIEDLLTASVKSGKKFIFSLSEAESDP